MRISLLPFLGVAVVVVAGFSVAVAQQGGPDTPPALDITVSVGPSHPRDIELLGRTKPGSMYCSLNVQEPGGGVVYFQPISLVLAPDGTERVTKEVKGLTFAFTAKAQSHVRIVQADLLISRGARDLGRYRSSAEYPSPASSQ